MKHEIFKGMATAMITPMTPHGVDYDTFAKFIEFQIESGINALVAVGTTGESATLSPEERKEVIRFTVKQVNGRVPVIAGTGTDVFTSEPPAEHHPILDLDNFILAPHTAAYTEEAIAKCVDISVKNLVDMLFG